jgi:hypothetical protein
METAVDLGLQFFCRKLRGKVACLLVESDREKGKASDSETLKFLNDAVADLAWCDRLLQNAQFDLSDRIKEYYVHHDQALAAINLADVAMDLGKREDARTYLRRSQRFINRLNEDRLSAGLKVPKPASLTRRFQDSSDRLLSLDNSEGIASGRSLQSPSPDNALKNGMRSG